MNPEIEAKLRLCPQLPTLSSVAIRIVSVARDPDIDIDAIVQLVSRDPALATKLLRVANSSLYKQFRNVHNLRQAITVLGLNATITLALSFSLAATLKDTQNSGIDLEHFWRRALLSALAARLLGNYQRTHSPDELFLAGLLQDLGMLALDAALPGRYAQEAATGTDHEVLIDREQATLATDHLEAGAWLMQTWHLPEYLSLATLGSHDRSRREAEADLEPFLGCVAVSGRLADIYLAEQPETATAIAQEVAYGCLGLPAEAIGDVLAQMVESLPEIEALFETAVLSQAQALGLTDQAREVLATRNLQLLQEAAQEQSREDEFKQLADRLYDIARRDALTGVFNRRHFDEALQDAFAEAGGQREPLSIAYLDLDYFKSINDRHGHLVGDDILSAVAHAIQRRLRQHDLLARYGGEEFVVLMPGLQREAAHNVVERIRASVEKVAHPLRSGENLHVTLSAGIASYGAGERRRETPAELVGAADHALYQAKRRGRNCVVQAE